MSLPTTVTKPCTRRINGLNLQRSPSSINTSLVCRRPNRPSFLPPTSFLLGSAMAASSRKKCTKSTCKFLAYCIQRPLMSFASPSALPSERGCLCGQRALTWTFILQLAPISSSCGTLSSAMGAFCFFGLSQPFQQLFILPLTGIPFSVRPTPFRLFMVCPAH